METVVVDTNCIVHRDWLLTTAPWRVLAYRSRQGLCSLVVPELVVREAVGRCRDAVAAASEKARTASADLLRLGLEGSAADINIDAATTSYEDQLRRSIDDAGGVVAEPPAINVLDLADRAIARRRPFDQKGGGFRDALLWAHVLATLSTGGSETVLVSADRSAFSDVGTPGDLATELKDEVRARGYVLGLASHIDAVSLFESITDYLEATGVEDPAITARINEIVEAEHAQLHENISVALEGARAYPYSGFDLITIEHARGLIRFVVAETFKPSPDAGLVLVALKAEADVDLHVEFYESRFRSHLPTELDGTATIGFNCTATYDPESEALDDLTIEPIAVDLDEMLEPGPRPTPYDQPLPW